MPVSCETVPDMNTTGNGNGVHGSTGPLVDRIQMGRLIRAARIVAGYDRVEDAAAAVQHETGVKMTARMLYSLERGEQTVSMEHMIAVVMTFQPPGAIRFFEGGTRGDVQAMFDLSRGD